MSDVTVIWPNRMVRGMVGGLSLTVDATNGSDAGGQRGGKSYKTLTAAKNAAQSGDTIIVYPGTYNENNLLKNGVNWYFHSGALVSYTNTLIASGSGTIYGIFDDRATGAVTCRVDGDGVFLLDFGNGLVDVPTTFSTGDPTLLTPNNTGKGVVVITNAGTDFTLKCNRLRARCYLGGSQPAVVFVGNCTRCEITADTIEDTNPTGPDVFLQTVDADDGGGGTFPVDVYCSPAVQGVYWEKGETFITARHILSSFYPVYAADLGAVAATNLWVTADLIEHGTGGVTGVYVNGIASGISTWRTYITCKELKSPKTAYGVYTSGRHYLTAQKITSPSGQSAILVSTGATVMSVWVTAQKIVGNIDGPNGGGSLYVDGLQFGEDDGTAPCVMTAGTGKLYVRGGRAVAGSIVYGAAGTARFSGLHIDDTGVATTPVTVSAAGLILHNCVLVAGSATNSITAAAARTITAYGVKANKAKHANVTVNVDAITVDVNVV